MRSSLDPPPHRLARIVRFTVLAATLAGLILGTAAAQQTPPDTTPSGDDPVLVDRRLGEEEQIRRRLEWFLSTRGAGTSSAAERNALRRAGVEATRQALEAQRSRRSRGIETQQNWWASKGPSPSNFGGWAFGTISGRVASLAADWSGGTLWVGTASGGVWKSGNDGLSWTSVFDGAGTMAVGTVAVDPNDPNVVWVGTGENVTGCEGYFGIGLLRTADGGLGWESRNGTGAATLEDLSSFANVVVDPRDSNHLITGGRIRGCTSGSQQSGALFTTNDGGLTWTKRLDGLEVYEIQQDPAVLDVYWAATSRGLYKSVDNGVGWTQQTASGLPSGGTGRTELAIAPSDGNVVYALFASGNGGEELWRTGDGGASWTLQSSGGDACDGQCWYNMVIRVHVTNPDIVYRGTVHVFRSDDRGVTWTDLSNNWGSSQKVHQDTHMLLMHPSLPDTFYVGCDGGVWKSENGGSTFLDRNGNLNITQFYAVGTDAADPEVICGGAQDNSSLARTTSDTWDLQTVTGDGFVCHIDPLSPSYAYITSYPSGGYPSVYRSTSGVLGSFSRITGSGSGIINGDRINWVTPYLLDPVSPNILYLGTHRVYKSLDRGSSWDQVGPGDLTGGSGSLLSLEINRSFPSYVFSGSASGRVWRTSDGGNFWSDITSGLPSRSINDIASDPTDPDRAFAVVGGFNTGHLWEWTLSGGWVERGAGLPNVPANTVFLTSASEVFVGTDTGVFRSSDGGVTFSPFMNGLPEGTVVTDLKYNPAQNTLTAGTYGRGAWQAIIDPAGPIVLYDSVELPLTELDGDGDGNVEPGETWGVRPLLRNVGDEDALDLTARLATDTPGVTVLDPAMVSFGIVAPGAPVGSTGLFRFAVDPSFACGDEVVFDLVDVSTSNPPVGHSDRMGAFSVTVVDGYEPPLPSVLLDESFDPPAPGEWAHQLVDPGLSLCWNLIYIDEWQIASKDAAHGDSYHSGAGPGGSYGRNVYGWLHHGGRDSLGGAGLVIPADSVVATLTLVHWYDTEAGKDGGQVALDAVEDGQDVYEPLIPAGGYPGAALGPMCNGLVGKEAFQGSSGGWVTSTFDLLPFKGKRVWLAFVFGSDKYDDDREGWYIDQVTLQTERLGPPICQVSEWPGSVPATALFTPAAGEIEASWTESCTEGSPAGQSYSVQAGDLDALATGGGFGHAPVGARCDLASPALFTPGPGNEYYLVVPHFGGRDGGAGSGSDGAPRPAASAVCGERRQASCP